MDLVELVALKPATCFHGVCCSSAFYLKRLLLLPLDGCNLFNDDNKQYTEIRDLETECTQAPWKEHVSAKQIIVILWLSRECRRLEINYLVRACT